MEVSVEENWLKPADYEAGRNFDVTVKEEGETDTQTGKKMPYLVVTMPMGESAYLSGWGLRCKKKMSIKPGDKLNISKKAGMDSRWLVSATATKLT